MFPVLFLLRAAGKGLGVQLVGAAVDPKGTLHVHTSNTEGGLGVPGLYTR